MSHVQTLAGIRSRCRRLDDDDAGKLICADVVLVDEVLQDFPQLLGARGHLLFTQDDHGDDLICLDALFDTALQVELLSGPVNMSVTGPRNGLTRI